MKKLVAICLGVLALTCFGAAQHPKYPYNHVYHSTLNTIIVWAEAYDGASTADMVNNAITANPSPAEIVITPQMAGNSCDFTGITLPNSNYILKDLRQGEIAWGFKDLSTNNVICQVQSGTGGTNINSLTVNSFNNVGTGANGLISGGAIYYTGTGYAYTVTRAQYGIGGVTYTSPQTNVTLAAADPTNPRIDVVYVDNTGSVGVLTGTPAVNPSEPSVNPTTQISLGFITVAAASTSPSGTSTENIYLEDAGPPAEWGCTTSGAGWNCADTTHPYAGTKDIQSLGTDASSYVKLTRSAAESVSGNNVLFFELRTESAWHGKFEVWLTFYNGSTAVGNTVFTQNNSFGWNGSTTGAYQLVGVPLSSFNLSSSQVDTLRIQWNNGGTSATNSTIYLDEIQLQQNAVGGGGSGGGGSSTGLSNVVITGNSSFFPNPLPSTTSSGVQTITDTPSNAPSNTVWAGPIGASGTNVAYKQLKVCTGSGTAAFACTLPNGVAGDYLAVTGMPTTGGSFGHWNTITSSQATITSYGGAGSNRYGVGPITVSGNVTLNFDQGDNNPWSVAIIELSGVGGFVSANSIVQNQIDGLNANFSFSQNVTPSTVTDGIVNILANAKGCYSVPNLTVSPGLFADGWTASNGASTGVIYISGPATTSPVRYTFTGSSPACDSDYVPLSLDFTQSVSSSTGPGSYKDLATLVRNVSQRAIFATSTFSIGAVVNLPSATNTTVLTGTVTMPATGCPCRVNLQSSIFLNSTTSGQWGWWASDGTNTWGYGASITTDAHTPPAGIGAISPVSYANGQAVTFSVIINPGTYASGTVQALSTLSPPLPAAAKSWMTVTVLPSAN